MDQLSHSLLSLSQLRSLLSIVIRDLSFDFLLGTFLVILTVLGFAFHLSNLNHGLL